MVFSAAASQQAGLVFVSTVRLGGFHVLPAWVLSGYSSSLPQWHGGVNWSQPVLGDPASHPVLQGSTTRER